jgi:hypothetical protein
MLLLIPLIREFKNVLNDELIALSLSLLKCKEPVSLKRINYIFNRIHKMQSFQTIEQINNRVNPQYHNQVS